MIKQAECCCGRCVIEVKSNPTVYGICHCNNCQKRTGSAFGLGMYFQEQDSKVISGSTNIYAPNSGDYGNQERHFCAYCGTTLYYYVAALKGLVGVAGGCFTESPLSTPEFSLENANKYSWISLPDTIKPDFSLDDVRGE
jgi:hypothetical protein